LNSWILINFYKQFRQKVNAFKNARDWAKTQQNKLIIVANNRVTDILKEIFILELSIYSMSQLSIKSIILDFEISIDKLSQKVSWDSSLFCKRLKKELEKRSSNFDLKIRFNKSCFEVYNRFRSRDWRF